MLSTSPSECTTTRPVHLTLTVIRGFDAAPLAEQLSHYTPVQIPYKPPFDYSRIATGLFALLSLVAALRFVSPILKSRWTWAAITVLTSLVMTSGYMFVRIRGMPYTGPNGAWVAGGYQSQFGQEVQVVAMICRSLHAPLVGILLMHTYRRYACGGLLDADARGAPPTVAVSSAHADLPLDWRPLRDVLSPRLPLQGEEPRYVFAPSLYHARLLTVHSQDIRSGCSCRCPDRCIVQKKCTSSHLLSLACPNLSSFPISVFERDKGYDWANIY